MNAQRELRVPTKEWEAALRFASTSVRLKPEDAAGWVYRARALYQLGRAAEARDNLLGVVARFPDNAILRYDLACYESRLGRLQLAKRWLEQAISLGNPWKMKIKALCDPDLEPLWGDIGEL